MPEIQVDQRKIHDTVLYVVKIMNVNDSWFHRSMVMTLEKYRSKSGGLGSTPGRDFIYYFFLLNYF